MIDPKKQPQFPLYWAIAFFILFFGLIFIRFPLNNSFIGNIDIWFYVWQWNDFFDRITDTATWGQVLYPEDNFRRLVGSSFGYGLLYTPYKFILGDDVWCFYAVLLTIMVLNGLALSLIFRELGIDTRIAVVMAVVVFANNYTLSNLENFNAYSLFPGLFSMYLLMRSYKVNKGKWGMLVLSGILAGLQVYYSIYLFLFQWVLLTLLFVYIHERHKQIGRLAIWFVCMVLVIIPFFAQRAEMSEYLNIPALQEQLFLSNESHSISFFKDWFRISKGNLIYPAMTDIENPWRYGARSAFFGFATYVLVLLAIIYHLRNSVSRKWKIWLTVALLGTMLVSTGPLFRTSYYAFQTPIGWINTIMPDTLVIRHLFRAHLLTILLFAFISAFYLQHKLKDRPAMMNRLLIVFLVVFVIENIPFKDPVYDYSKYKEPPAALIDALQLIPERSNLFFLPSCHIIQSEAQVTDQINPMNREYIYMNWKNFFEYNTFNGRMGYLTNTSYENTLLTCNMNATNFDQLIEQNDIDYFIYIRAFDDVNF